jgi:hypothetical protein
MSAPTESQHLAEFVVGTTEGRGLQPPVRCALAAGLLAVHRNHDLAQRALSRVNDGLCRRVTNYVPSVRFEAKTYRPRGADLVIPYVRDHGAPPPRRRHRVEARIPRSDKKPYFRVLPIRRDIRLLHWQGKVKSTLHRQVSIFGYLGLPLPKHPSIIVCTFCAFQITTLTTPYCLR